MMDFITIPLTFGIVTYGIYKLFELFVCKKERLFLLEKMNFDNVSNVSVKDSLKKYNTSLPFSFSALKVGCLLIGLGLGIITGIILFALNADAIRVYGEITHHSTYSLAAMILSAGVLCMGGAGLLLAFIIEYICSKKKN